MRIRRSGQRRPNASTEIKRRLVMESLETRWMLASLTSRLPAITITVGTEPVQIRSMADPAEEASLPTAAISALKELAFLKDLFADTNRSPDDAYLASLQSETWLPFTGVFDNDAFDAIPVEKAVEIANMGFEVVGPPVEDVIAQVFGPPLSVTSPIERHENDPKIGRLDPQTSATDPFDSTNRLSDIPVKHETDLLAESPVDSEQQEEVPRQSGAVRTADRGQKKAVKVASSVAIEHQSLVSESGVPDRQVEDQNFNIAGMVQLQQPLTEADHPVNDQAERFQYESQPENITQLSLTTGIDQKIFEQMQLLPMVPDVEGERGREVKMIAGFNPVAMLQIFVGGELGNGSHEVLESADLGAERSGPTEAATEPLDCRDHITATAFVIVVGYWYFHNEIDRRLLSPAGTAVRSWRPKWITSRNRRNHLSRKR